MTAHGKPVAKLVPAGADDKVAARARKTLLARLRAQPVAVVGRWSRDELYQDAR